MKDKIIACSVLLLLAAASFAAAPGGRSQQGSTAALDTEKWIDANQILMFVTNQGGFANQATNVFGKSDGLYFPFTSIEDIQSTANDNTVIFAAGLWMGATDAATGDTLTVVAEFSNEYFPGPMAGGTFTTGGDTDPEFRVYKLTSDMTSADQEWQDYMNLAVPQGAPTRLDSLGDPMPDIIGDQFLWSVYTDANPAYKTNDASSTDPLGVEVRQSTFAFDREDALGKVVFMRFQIFNKGGKDLENMFISLWADPDLGGASDDLVGCDTFLSLGYCYNATNADNDYGSSPPAVGFDFFQGPLVFTGDDADTAIMWGFTKFPQYTNLGMTSFNKYINGTDPQNYVWTYQYMNGLDASQAGAILNDPETGIETKFFGAGDPVTGTGWIDANESDRRWMQTTGPIDFADGDSTEIIAAVVVGKGADRLSSITALKFFDETAQETFDNEFDVPPAPAAPAVTAHALNRRVALEWGNSSETDPGQFPFEGYTIFQGESSTGPWKRLANYDLVNDVLVIQELDFDEAAGVAVVRPTKFGSDNGLRRFFSTTQDAINGGPLSNYTPYYFRVEAYSYTELFDPQSGDKIGERTLTSATNVTVTPQGPVAGDEVPTDYGEVLSVTHPFGLSQGVVTPMVVGPDALTGHEYEITFGVDTALATIFDTICEYTDSVGPDTCAAYWDTLGDSIVIELCSHECDSIVVDTIEEGTVRVFWNLQDLTTGDMKLMNQYNQTGDEDYVIVDGVQIKVAGPAPGFLEFQIVANGSGPVDPPAAAAFNFQGFPTPNDENPGDGADDQAGAWGIHTADDGGTNGGGTRGGYSAFLSRVLRNNNSDVLAAYDYEMRFTGDPTNPGVEGGYAIEWFNDDNVFWVPFELWRIGIGTPNDPSDDVRLVPQVIDDGDDNTFNLESYGSLADSTCMGDCEHSASGGDDDPFTDWVYWYLPTDQTPGEAGYLANEAQMLGATYDQSLIDAEVMARIVLVSWNGGTAPPFAQDLPEQGTVFRMVTAKPNAPSDVFRFTAPAPVRAAAGGEEVLNSVRAVPNPYYLASSYDNSVVERRMKFTNLPADATVKIFSLAGAHVTTIERTDATQGAETWNLENDFGIPVASGIYIYVVESPKYGTKVGKMAIFTEEEQLNTF